MEREASRDNPWYGTGGAMGGFSAEPESVLRMNDLAKPWAFAVRGGTLVERIDVNYWRLAPIVERRFERARFPVVSLGTLLTLVQYGSSALASSEPIGVPMLRMNNLQ